MEITYLILLGGCVCVTCIFVILWHIERTKGVRLTLDLSEFRTDCDKRIKAMHAECLRLMKWSTVANADEKAQQILSQAHEESTRRTSDAAENAQRVSATAQTNAALILANAQEKADNILADAQDRFSSLASKASEISTSAEVEAALVTAKAQEKAENILTEAQRQSLFLASKAAETASRIAATAETMAAFVTAKAQEKADTILAEAQSYAAELRAKADNLQNSAQVIAEASAAQGKQILDAAQAEAQRIAGQALEAVQNADLYQRTATAMRNIIEGYGDEYLVPAESLLDGLAEEFSHKDAGQQLKIAREQTKSLIKLDHAATCDYVETTRREGAERFVLDAFNGKVDSILSRIKHDNFGTLSQEVRDAFTIVNFGGKPFRDARITDVYLNARLAELKWGCAAQELKRQEQEEQRRIREQIREEEKARREFERAMKDAAREEEIVRKAMAKAQAQAAAASDEQRSKYEAQLEELSERLKLAEERNQRALSMAQQTRRGHVYIISNVGSFGDGIYKVGLTRRLEPLDRIRELGDASVPFEFDVHAIILSEDAPALELRLHKHFVLRQVNKVNHRKEFFRASIADIRKEIELLGIEAQWTMAAQAREYRETLAIERVIEADPEAREAWINRQLTLDPVSYTELATAETEE